jgi:hypothetical protein
MKDIRRQIERQAGTGEAAAAPVPESSIRA